MGSILKPQDPIILIFEISQSFVPNIMYLIMV